MSRFHQRLRERMQNPDFATGYHEMHSELQLVQALNRLREDAHVSTEELAQSMGRQRAAVSRLFNAAQPNPTLETLTDLLKALGVTAEIHLRPSQEGEAPIKIEVVSRTAQIECSSSSD
jgi:transcriptional regulator with XRE-family HTH domain